MSNPQVEYIGQVQPGHKPAEYEVDSTYQQSFPRPQRSRGEIHAGQRIQENNCIANDVVYFHNGSPWGYSIITFPKTVFLTGATGVLGGRILKDLLQATTARVYCLVR